MSCVLGWIGGMKVGTWTKTWSGESGDYIWRMEGANALDEQKKRWEIQKMWMLNHIPAVDTVVTCNRKVILTFEY